MSCHEIKKVLFDLEKYKGIWSMVRYSCAMNMNLIYILFLAAALDWEWHNVSQAWDDLEDIGQGHSEYVEWLTFI